MLSKCVPHKSTVHNDLMLLRVQSKFIHTFCVYNTHESHKTYLTNAIFCANDLLIPINFDKSNVFSIIFHAQCARQMQYIFSMNPPEAKPSCMICLLAGSSVFEKDIPLNLKLYGSKWKERKSVFFPLLRFNNFQRCQSQEELHI